MTCASPPGHFWQAAAGNKGRGPRIRQVEGMFAESGALTSVNQGEGATVVMAGLVGLRRWLPESSKTEPGHNGLRP
jgi:hypothetical protein